MPSTPGYQKLPELVPPVDNTWEICQKFGENPDIYQKFHLEGHNGIDFNVPEYTPFFAAANGIIIKKEIDKTGYGLFLKITHDQFSTIYAHLISAQHVECGQPVKAGQIIGYSGKSGFCKRAHLHFECRLDGIEENGYHGAIDPLLFIGKQNQTPSLPTQYGLVLNNMQLHSAPYDQQHNQIGKIPAGIIVGIDELIVENGQVWAKLGENRFGVIKSEEKELIKIIK
ncbi:MAG: M23 family metallopeptidase [Anaerolineaceae bacterium]|nr:M23 family metallopeptidase [Anaerolineaceae bacterium]